MGDSLFQLWKKKRGVLTPDRLSLFPAGAGARPKELRFHSILKVDCVERTGKYVYFTIVTTDRKEIDFRCAGESCWSAAITIHTLDESDRTRGLAGRSPAGARDVGTPPPAHREDIGRSRVPAAQRGAFPEPRAAARAP
ncbi:pleckstrin homology-like domain family A member 2 [Pteropus alecto]|uniref:pleckstrin homology-like domain family A member 2 n=1 Tax=Pteropus alecto TaxID=9402 RepID=UPI000D5341DA|nr:pleckstrin homology-like domain family A member 2 [Pteropus alecto]